MKKTILLFLCLFLANLYSQKTTIVPYLLNIDAENSIYKFIKTESQDSIAFYFERIEKEKIKIHFTKGDSKSLISNRKLFINDKFYPIIFDTDYSFFVNTENDFPTVQKFEDKGERNFKVVKMPTIAERLKNKSLYAQNKIMNVIDWSTFWIVDLNGKLLETNSK